MINLQVKDVGGAYTVHKIWLNWEDWEGVDIGTFPKSYNNVFLFAGQQPWGLSLNFDLLVFFS